MVVVSRLDGGGRPKTNRRHHENAIAEIVIAGGYVPDVSGLFSVFLIDNYHYYRCCIVWDERERAPFNPGRK